MEISQEQQVTERFTRAIDQLGATEDKGKKKLEIRLGGIYALERISRDSAKDHWPIMETLATYVRETRSLAQGGHARNRLHTAPTKRTKTTTSVEQA